MKYLISQLLFTLIFTVFCACGIRREEVPIIPPVTSPLSGNYIGYGVIIDSFTHVTEEPNDDSESLRYLRRGTLVNVLRRQSVRVQTGFESWIMIDGEPQGWLRENVIEIYESENQARTASELLTR